MLEALLAIQISMDTLRLARVPAPPVPAEVPDTVVHGSPQVRLQTAQGKSSIWLLQAADTVFIAAVIPDSTRHWGDAFALSIDIDGDGGASPGHDDFHWEFRRALDSSVVFRGRNGRWEPPMGDIEWRLGPGRSGGGWEVSGRDEGERWMVLLRLDPAWLAAVKGRLPRVAVRVYDNDPDGWFAWPMPKGTPQAASVEQVPDLWAPVRSDPDN